MQVDGAPFDLRVRGAMGKVNLSVVRGDEVITSIIIPAGAVPDVCRALAAAVTVRVRPDNSRL